MKDLTKIDRREENERGHWRGFTKYLQPDGKYVAVSERTLPMGQLLGPVRHLEQLTPLIEAFYVPPDEGSQP